MLGKIGTEKSLKHLQQETDFFTQRYGIDAAIAAIKARQEAKNVK